MRAGRGIHDCPPFRLVEAKLLADVFALRSELVGTVERARQDFDRLLPGELAVAQPGGEVSPSLVDPELRRQDGSLIELGEERLVMLSAVVAPAELPREDGSCVIATIGNEIEQLHQLDPARA